MFNHYNWRLLQLFGGEGASGASATGDGGTAGAATTGDNSVDAGHQRLRELGVPESRIRKPRAKQASALPEGAIRYQPQPSKQPAQQVAAAETTNAQKTEAPTRMSWDDVMKDPEYNQKMQEIIKARVKDGDQNRSILETLAPAIKHLAQENGLDPENVDYTALAKLITGEYEDKALEMGVSKKTAMELDQKQRTLEQEKHQKHFKKLEQQGEALKAIYPNFDMRKEMENPTFVRLTSPQVGLSVEDAFYAVHRKELQAQSMQVAAHQTQQMISNAIQSGTHRPDETGTASQAPSVSRFDYSKATPAQRKAIKDEIRRAAAEGRKVYPGSF